MKNTKKIFWLLVKLLGLTTILTAIFVMFVITTIASAIIVNVEEVEKRIVKNAEETPFVCNDENECNFSNIRPSSSGFVSDWGSIVLTAGYYDQRPWGVHGAIDLAGANDPYTVKASHDGVVSITMFQAVTCKLNGNYYSYDAYPNVTVANEEYKTGYLHMIDLQVENGQVVKKGDSLGTMGNAGCSTGTHLHYTVFEKHNGHYTKVNPEDGYIDL